MIIIRTNSKNIIEKEYIFKVVFDEFIGIAYKVQIDESLKEIELNYDDIRVQVATTFFNSDKLICINNIPNKCTYLNTPYQRDRDIPIFYGTSSIQNVSTEYSIKFDLFGIIFFMLTRWEESLSDDLDLHGRFKAKNSIAYKFGFLERPIVNELVNIIIEILNTHNESKKHYQVYLTHDIDHLYYPCSFRKFAGDILKRKSIKSFLSRIKYALNSPYNNFKWIIEQSNCSNHQSSFYFMASKPGGINNDYYLNDSKIKNAFENIQNKHIIGIHPSYESHLDSPRLKNELSDLNQYSSSNIKEGRQHFLRFQAPITWNIWNNAGLEIDSTLGFAELPGFRCGTGNTYTVFDFIDRKILKLKERPLICMDTTLRYYLKHTNAEFEQTILKFKTICKRHNTSFTLLFHNSSFDNIEWPSFTNTYLKILKILS